MSVASSKYDEILRQYDKKRLNLQHEQHIKQQEIYKKVPRIKEIDDTISSLSVQTAKSLLLSKDASMDSFKTQITALKAEKTSLLNENFTPEFLNLSYECPDCKDTGYIDGNKCHCFKRSIINALYEQSNLKDILENENFGTFNLRLYKNDCLDSATGMTPLDNISRAIQTSKEFINNFDKEFKNLFIYGATGVGKTFLTNCIAKELIDKSHSVVYISAIKLFDILADNAFGRGGTDIEQQYANIFDCDLLIIDDLGTELVNNFSVSQLFNCINERYLNQKSVIISSNLSISDLRDMYSERIFSRITSNYTLMKIFGDDLRITKKTRTL